MPADLQRYLLQPGVLDIPRMQEDGLYPSDERIRKGPIAVLECSQEIPCNPCETACKKGFIEIGSDITALPRLDPECSGCGLCLPRCPGLSIFIVDGSLPGDLASVTIPYEFLPLPEVDEVVDALDRWGERVCDARIISIKRQYPRDLCYSIKMEIPFSQVHTVRHFRKKRTTGEGK